MSDLSISLEALERSRSQLPVNSYFDEGVFGDERALIFEPAPTYAGHELWVPERGDFHALAQEGEGRALVHGSDGVQLVSNVCRHRQALMLRGRGHTREHIVCPIHRWTYDLQGRLVGAPHFEADPCLHLKRYPLQNWHGLLFEQRGRDVAALLGEAGAMAELDFERPRAGPRGTARVRLQLEDLHRGLSGGLPRRALPPRAGRLRQPVTTCAGSSATTIRCRRWACSTRWRGPVRPPTAAGTTPC